MVSLLEVKHSMSLKILILILMMRSMLQQIHKGQMAIVVISTKFVFGIRFLMLKLSKTTIMPIFLVEKKVFGLTIVAMKWVLIKYLTNQVVMVYSTSTMAN